MNYKDIFLEVAKNNEQTFEGHRGIVSFSEMKQALIDRMLSNFALYRDDSIPVPEGYTYSVPWYPSDTPEQFEKNLNSEDKLLLKKFGWVDNKGNPTPVSYNLNKYGYRCIDDLSKPGILFIGCSLTFCTGVNVEHSWPYLVAKHFDLEPYNFGRPAQGIDGSCMMASLFLREELKNLKAIVVFLPPPGRHDYFIRSVQNDLGISGTFMHLKKNDEYINTPMETVESTRYEELTPETILQHTWWSKENCVVSDFMNIGWLKQMAGELDIPLIVKDASKLYDTPVSDFNIQKFDNARDLMHYGPSINKYIAQKIIMSLDI